MEEIKNRLDEKLHGYLNILLLMPGKSEVNEMAKQNLINQVDGNDLQKIVLFQHEINNLEKRINEAQEFATQVEVLPPVYS